MAYADYEFYTQVYKGSLIPEADFAGLMVKAEAYLDYITRNQIRGKVEDSISVKLGVCSVAEAYFSILSGGGVASERVGEWSVNYVADKDCTFDRRLYEAARLHLANTPLLGRWL